MPCLNLVEPRGNPLRAPSRRAVRPLALWYPVLLGGPTSSPLSCLRPFFFSPRSPASGARKRKLCAPYSTSKCVGMREDHTECAHVNCEHTFMHPMHSMCPKRLNRAGTDFSVQLAPMRVALLKCVECTAGTSLNTVLALKSLSLCLVRIRRFGETRASQVARAAGSSRRVDSPVPVAVILVVAMMHRSNTATNLLSPCSIMSSLR